MNIYLRCVSPDLLLLEAARIEKDEPYSVLKLLKLSILNLASMSLEEEHGDLVTEKFVIEELSGIADNHEVRVPLSHAMGLQEEIQVSRERFEKVKESQVREEITKFVTAGILKRFHEN
jgi:hypothetical protein